VALLFVAAASAPARAALAPVNFAQADYERAQEMLREGDYASGSLLLRQLAGSFTGPTQARILYEIGLCDTDPERSYAELMRSAQLHDTCRAAANLACAELALALDDPATALAYCDSAIRLRQEPEAERATVLRGQVLLAAHEWTEARDAFADYLVTYLEGAYQPEARLGIATVNEALGRTRESIEIYRAMLDQHPGFSDEPWILYRLSRLVDTRTPNVINRYQMLLNEKYPDYLPDEQSFPGAGPAFPGAIEPAVVVTAPAATPAAPSRAPRRDTVPARPAVTAAPRRDTAPARPAVTTVSRRDTSPLRPTAPATAPRNATPARRDTAPARPATTPPRRDTASAQPVAARRQFYIQVGAFSKPENARALIVTLKTKGFKPTTVTRNKMTAVLVGPYAKQADAAKLTRSLQALAGQKVHVIEQ